MAALTLALTDLLPMDWFIHAIAPVLAGTAWLAIHVPVIMLGCAILALGLAVAHMQIGAAIFAPRRTDLTGRMCDLHYGYMFVGSIFPIAGIITGSMRAASSWGRYWGWDPREVWSLGPAGLPEEPGTHRGLKRRAESPLSQGRYPFFPTAPEQ